MFEYDVFLSYSSKDKGIVHALAERLKKDGLHVWLDKWEIRPGEFIPKKIQNGLENSNKILMCMSPAYFESEWGRIECYTLLFDDPTNTQLRLIPLLIEDCILPKVIAPLAYVDWRTRSDEAYGDILNCCLEEDGRDERRTTGNFEISKTCTSPSTGMEFVLISAGKFIMGSPSGEQGRWDFEGPVHEVIIKNSFSLGKFPVTQKQWKVVMGSNPSHFKGDDLPVECVSWNDVQEFIKKLNQMEGTDKYRLPSEAEWEYACRAGTTTRYSFGNDESKLGDYAWYSGYNTYEEWEKNKNKILSEGKTYPIGQKKPNSWGLYDMHGNVWEWCQDTWHENYNGAPSDGSSWEGGSSSFRVFRGGSWYVSAGYCRSACRIRNDPVLRNILLGFRLLRKL